MSRVRDNLLEAFSFVLPHGAMFGLDCASNALLLSLYKNNIPLQQTMAWHVGYVSAASVATWIAWVKAMDRCCDTGPDLKMATFLQLSFLTFNRLGWLIAYELAKDNNLAQNVAGAVTGLVLSSLFVKCMVKRGGYNKVCCAKEEKPQTEQEKAEEQRKIDAEWRNRGLHSYVQLRPS